MRIVSGTHKGRPIKTPLDLPVRPTTDLAKESLFNILNNNFYFDELNVLDLFSGTGNISYEFASREAKSITCVELNIKCTEFIKKTALSFGFKQIFVVTSDVDKYLSKINTQYNLIFADPPYELSWLDKIPDLVFKNNILSENGWLVVEHSSNTDFSNHVNFKQLRKYGKVHFSIFSI